jgi:hypothetical protein
MVRGISRDTSKLARTPTLIKKLRNKKYINYEKLSDIIIKFSLTGKL